MRILLALLLFAASPSPLAASAPVADDAELRLARVGYRLATANLTACGEKRGWWSGMLLSSIGQWPLPERAAAMAKRRMTSTLPFVMAVLPGGAAERAGIRAGDAIVSAGTQSFKDVHPRPGSFAEMAKLEVALEGEAVALVVRRTGGDVSLILRPDAGCASRLSLKQSRKLNAGADGVYAEITTATLGFTVDDDELAFVTAHEMAHNILAHAALFDRLGKSVARVKETEIAADKMAVQLMHGAGFDPFAAARFWARFGKKTSLGFLSAPTHLRTKKRVALLTDEARRVSSP